MFDDVQIFNNSKWQRFLPSVLWHCWLGGWKGIRPVKNLSGGVVAWLSVWSKMQTCTWPSWCHCHSLSLASVKSRLVLPFWYQLMWVVPEKGPLNGCVCVLEIVVFFGYISFAAVICCFVVSLQLHQNLVWILRRYYSPLRRVWCGRRWLRHDAAFRHRIWRHWGCAEVRRTRSYSLYYGRQSERCAGSRVYNGSSAVWPNHGRSIRAREARFAAVERRLPGPADRICPTAWPASAWCERNPWH